MLQPLRALVRLTFAVVLLLATVLAAPPPAAAGDQTAGANSAGTHNLLLNPDFDSSLADWTTIGSVVFVSNMDAGGNASSGSAGLQEKPGQSADLVQCVDLPIFWRSVNLSLSWYSLAHTTNGASFAQVQYYASPGCSGQILSQTKQPTDFTNSNWNQFSQLGVAPPALAQSASVAFGALNGDPTTQATAVVDTTFFGYTITAGVCGQDPTLLCADDNRFQIKAKFSQACSSGNGDSAAGVQDTAAGGFLWCFDPGNPEIFAKVLDACTPATGNTYWVFLSGLTNVGVTITVTDTKTGKFKTYSNPSGTNFQPIFDTAGLAVCP